MVLDGAVLRNVDEGLRRELQHIGHDREVHIERAQRTFRRRALQVRKLDQSQTALLRRQTQRVRLGAGFLGSAEHARHLVAACQKRFQNALAERLLAVNHDTH